MAEYGRVLALIESRRGRLEALEERASRGSMADVIETLLAQTVGTVRYTVQPYEFEAKQVLERLYRLELQRKLDRAFWYYFATGLGGIAITPLGLRVVDPKRFAWDGDVDDPVRSYRVFEVSRDQLRGLARQLRVEEYEAEALALSVEGERVGVVEVYDHDVRHWEYCLVDGERVVARMPARWYEGHYLLTGRYRPRRLARATGLEGFPIGVTEHSRHHADYYDELYEATIRDTMQGTLLQAYLPGIDDEARERLVRNFRVVPLRQPQPAAFPLKEVNLGTVSAVRQQVNYELGMSSGAIGYARGVPMDVEYATEAAMIGQNAQVRVSRWADYHLQFVERVLEGARGYWSDLPLSLHRHFFKVGESWYGVERVYGDALRGRQVLVMAVSADFVEQRQQAVVLLSLLGKVLPALGGVVDVQGLTVELLRRLLWSHGIDPDEYLLSGGSAYSFLGDLSDGMAGDLSAVDGSVGGLGGVVGEVIGGGAVGGGS